MIQKFASPFSIGEQVIIDGDPSLVGVVCAVMFRPTDNLELEIGYVHNGDAKKAWIESSRLKAKASS